MLPLFAISFLYQKLRTQKSMNQFKNGFGVCANLISKTLRFGEAVLKYSEDDNSKFTGGMRQQAEWKFSCLLTNWIRILLLIKKSESRRILKTNPIYRRER